MTGTTNRRQRTRWSIEPRPRPVESDLTERDLIRVVEALTGIRPQSVARDTPTPSEPTIRSG
jgi:hypothetical protein